VKKTAFRQLKTVDCFAVLWKLADVSEASTTSIIRMMMEAVITKRQTVSTTLHGETSQKTVISKVHFDPYLCDTYSRQSQNTFCKIKKSRA
jgi:hypothetical protein